MSMKNILFSYPHCSSGVPKELEKKLNISKKDLILTMDYKTNLFFSNFKWEKIFAQTHLLFWNLNRHISWTNLLTSKMYNEYNWLFPTKLPHNLKDIYMDWFSLSKKEKSDILKRYYIKYYKSITDIIISKNIDYIIDVHSCDPFSNWNQVWTWKRRDIILWNLWDENGDINKIKWYITFDKEKLNKLKKILEDKWLIVSLNKPFSWWNITQQFWLKKPILQLEINKNLYLEEDLLTLNEEKFKKINLILEEALNWI